MLLELLCKRLAISTYDRLYAALVKLFNCYYYYYYYYYYLFFTIMMNKDVYNETSCQCAPLQHDRLFQLINGVKLPAVVDSLQQGPQMA